MPTLVPYKNGILCTDADFGGMVTETGVIVQPTLGTLYGVVDRWFKVFAVGTDIDFVKPGEWILVKQGRWTEGVELEDSRFNTEDNREMVWKVEPESCLLASDEKPTDRITYSEF